MDKNDLCKSWGGRRWKQLGGFSKVGSQPPPPAYNWSCLPKPSLSPTAMATGLNKKSISDLDLKGKRVLMRVDFNVPQDKKTGVITNPRTWLSSALNIKY